MFPAARLDLTEGTPEADFVAAMENQVADKEDILIPTDELENFAPQAAVVEDQTTLQDYEKLFDGGYSSSDWFTLGGIPGELVLEFEEPQEIDAWRFYNDMSRNYGLADFEVQYSTDGTTWNTLGTAVTGCADREVTQVLETPVTAKYFKLIATAAQSRGADVREFCLYNYKNIVISAEVVSDAQRPAVYYAETEDEAVTVRADGTPADVTWGAEGGNGSWHSVCRPCGCGLYCRVYRR